MKQVIQFLTTAVKKVYTMGEQPVSLIDSAERQLGLTFPTMLRDYLQQYGALSYGSVELLGLGVPEISYRSLVMQTRELRECGLPHNYIAIEDQGEGFYILMALDGQIYQWNLETRSIQPSAIANNLDDYLTQHLQTA
jgi:hypothetical protein